MAVTVTVINRDVIGSKRYVTADVAFDSQYAIGGEPVTAADFGLEQIDNVIPGVAVDPDTTDNAFLATYDRANAKIQLFTHGTDAAADAPLKELADTTAANAYTARVTAIGW